ncbi:MAG: hypothetical protein JJ864_18210 [Rhizobiaceae bacterium]|nr:hypothetical protein [Rhizobiaceae bacterium]
MALLTLAAIYSFLLSPIIPAHAVSDAAILAKRPPKLLSEFGFFADMWAQTPAKGVVPFTINTPLFSDKALKYRFVYLPEGATADFVADEAFEFPAGTALIKTFAFPADFRAPDKDIRLIETRLLLRGENGWNAWAYVWNEAQTEAELRIAGAKVRVEAAAEDGSPLDIAYSVPNKNQCKGCHALNGEIVPIGPKARNLNGDLSYADGTRNQIDHWIEQGMLNGAPAVSEIDAVPAAFDGAAPLDARARAWLDVNCAHCHRRDGPASNSGLFLTWGESDRTALGVLKRPVAAGRGAGDREFDIVPGDPDGSILIFRVDSTEPGVMMPELGRSLGDPDAVRLLRDWIAGMGG